MGDGRKMELTWPMEDQLAHLRKLCKSRDEQITALEAENARLTKERDNWRRIAGDEFHDEHALRTLLVKAEARAERAEAGARECARHLVETGRALKRAEAACAEMREALERLLAAHNYAAAESWDGGVDMRERMADAAGNAKIALSNPCGERILVDPKGLLEIRDALVMGDVDEAFHQLRVLADPDPEVGRDHWEKWEALAAKEPNKISLDDGD